MANNEHQELARKQEKHQVARKREIHTYSHQKGGEHRDYWCITGITLIVKDKNQPMNGKENQPEEKRSEIFI